MSTESSLFTSESSQEFPVGVFSQNAYLPRIHHHIEYELFYLAKGEAEFYAEGNTYSLKTGDVFFIEPETEHYVKRTSEEDNFHYYAFVFDISIFGKETEPTRQFFESIKIRRFLNLGDELFEKIKTCINYKKENSFGCNFIIKSLLFEIVSFIIQTRQYEQISPLLKMQKHNVSAIDNAIIFIHEHFRENISFDDIQKNTDYSKSHFARLFKESVGMNVTEYLNKFRVEKSCLDLIYTNKNITQVAGENGFNNIQYFSRVFRQLMKCTPKQYQKRTRDVIVPSAIPNRIM